MKGEMSCPRCGRSPQPPGAWSNRWTCGEHGEIFPLSPVAAPSARLARQLGERSDVPLWLVWPLMRGWVVGALLSAGDDVHGVQGTAVAISGPNPFGGAADLVLVAEEQDVGLGAGLAGVEGRDPGDAVKAEPQARVEVDGRTVPLWCVTGHPDRAVYAGHWDGRWLWMILRPHMAGALLLEDLVLADLRMLGSEAEMLPYGAPPPWLAARYGYDQ
ncbi:DUF6758 family protein [Phytoactinopolyspora halotolerans]|uniref:Phosphotransacetylase n=1 Tax=Phytoactinopolyspora halotolerans TaxID=1981512 RepID=A0A6L9SFS9_9ACTN|nr:DUF6758 family protein [Phytoactinopolyspora halotolerans]NEE04116.1 hypothetical protein [Phytoactinopolyspora halotolerans]